MPQMEEIDYTDLPDSESLAKESNIDFYEGLPNDEPVELSERELPPEIPFVSAPLRGAFRPIESVDRLPTDMASFSEAVSRGEIILPGKELPVRTPTGIVLKGPEDIRREREREAEDAWAEVLGKSVVQGGLIVPTTIGAASRFLNDALGLDFRGVGPEWLQDIPDLYDLSKEADEFWTPDTGLSETKRYTGKVARTMTEMGAMSLFLGPQGMLPGISVSSGLQKFVEAREEGAEFWRATAAGTTQAAIEYTTEKLPIGILLKPQLSFSRRLMLGLVTDVPGELMATSGEMALVDTQILGKRYTLDQYISSLKETAIVAVGVTGGMTVASHPMVKEVEEFEKEVKSDPDTFEAEFQRQLNETAGIKEEPPTPEQLKEIEAQDIKTAKKALTDIGIDEETAEVEATKFAKKAAELREIFHQEEIREEPVEVITEDIATQLQATGRFTEEDARLQAEALYGTFFTSMAKRIGVDPIDLFESYNLSIGRERAIRPDTEGITYDQAGQIKEETPEFKAWFGESKVVDEVGEPKTVYHWTDADRIDAFQSGNSAGTIYFGFTPETAKAAARGKKISMELYLSVQNPINTIDTPVPWGEAEDSIQVAEWKEQGHDGVYVEDEAGISIAVFEPTQIKSVFAQRFDPTDPRILAQESNDPEVIAESLGIIYNGIQEGIGTVPDNFLFTDNITGTTFGVENLSDVASRLQEKRKEFGVVIEQPLFQAQKGRIIFGPEGVNIELLKDADPSTLLHETGHFYLKVLGDLARSEIADQELRNDAQIVAGWLEAKNLDVLTREQSEKWARGFEAYLREGKAPSSALRKAFAQFKEWLTEVYQRMRSLNVELTPEVRGVMDRMLASQEEIEAVQTEIDEATIDLVTEGRDLNKITQAEIKKHLTPAARRTVKGLILETVGKRQAHKFIREDKALSASWKKAEQSARKAFKAGKLEEAAKWKLKMKEVLTKANAKVEKIQTEKQKMAKRRRTINTIKNYLGLTDTQMKGLTKHRNVANMTDWEFKEFKDDILIRAEQLQETVEAKARVMEVIERKQLQKVENYQKSLGLPTIHKMTAKQLNEFVELLEVFEDADVFLTTKELETVDRTDLKGIRTWREAKERLAKETGVSIEDLNAIKVNWTDKFKWDNSLAESNPFYALLVTEMNKKLLQAEARVHEVENEIFKLAKASEKSRGRSITRKLIPQDPQIMAYLEASEDVKPSIAKEMTPEQLDLAHYMGQYFNQALEYLKKTKSLDKGRENYFVHIRRSFLETLKDDGLGTAVTSVFKNYQEEEMVFNIFDGDTGNILPLEKFFQFSLRRTGALTPTQNIVKAFLTYTRTFEKKVTLDEIIPKLDIYAQSLTPKKMTPRGLEIDRSLKKFVYQYVNNKKGRQIDLGFVKQGDKVDLSIRALRTFTTLLDLGLSIPVGVASFIGEQTANFTMLGEKGIILGTTRGKTKKGKAILEKYEAFVGRSVWEEFKQPGKEIGERVMEGMFGLFHQATVTANKQFLLASLTKAEYDSGTISDERLAQLRIEMGRFRAIPGAKSLIGSTSPGGAAIQYKSWAVPIIRTVTKDLTTLATDLKNKPTGEALTTREARELFRAIRLSFIAVLVLGFGDREDKTFVGQLSYKTRREVLTVLQAISPDMWLSTPRLVGFVTQLGKNLKSLIMLEEYKTKPGLKGVGGIKRQFKPSIVRQLTPEEKKGQRR